MSDHKLTREQIIDRHPMRQFLARRGAAFIQKGGEFYTLCPFHNDGKKDKHGSLRIKEKDQTWYCDVCAIGGSVIDFVMREKGVQSGEAMKLLSDGVVSLGGIRQPAGSPMGEKPEKTTPPDQKSQIKDTYDYLDSNGTLRYQAVRLEPKDFRQRRPDGSGGWIWNLQGVERVLFNLQTVLTTKHPVWIVEGEKDATTLISLGFVGTTNVCGAGKWMDAYSMSLRGKTCVVCPDKDEKGEQHRDKVMASIADYAKNVRYVKLPDPYKDVTEMVEAIGKEKAVEILTGLFDAAVELIGGMVLPIYSMDEAESHYIEHVKDARRGGMLDLGCWLPTLGKCIRPLVPGDFVVYLASTGAGKTAALQNICLTSGLECLFFELEVTSPTIFERFAQISTGITGEEIEKSYESGSPVLWRNDDRLKRLHICVHPKLTTEDIEKLIIKSELKIGRKPRLVVVDYIQLVRATKAASRYERFSDIAENLKVIAKTTGTIIIAASQISRKGDSESPEVFLHDAKESGSIENSAGLILGGWLDDDDRTKLTIKVLKCTRGRPGARVICNFFGETMRINERVKTQDVPI